MRDDEIQLGTFDNDQNNNNTNTNAGMMTMDQSYRDDDTNNSLSRYDKVCETGTDTTLFSEQAARLAVTADSSLLQSIPIIIAPDETTGTKDTNNNNVNQQSTSTGTGTSTNTTIASNHNIPESQMTSSPQNVVANNGTPTSFHHPQQKERRIDTAWNRRILELQAYRETHGHVRVPRNSSSLGEWVRSQRRYFKQRQKGDRVPLTMERIRTLEAMGFVWSASVPEDMIDGRQLLEVEDEGEEGRAIKRIKRDCRTETLTKTYEAYDECLAGHEAAIQAENTAEIQLEQAKIRLKMATQKRKSLEDAVEKFSNDVLHAELEGNPDEEWNVMFRRLIDYKKNYGHILFPKGYDDDIDVIKGDRGGGLISSVPRPDEHIDIVAENDVSLRQIIVRDGTAASQLPNHAAIENNFATLPQTAPDPNFVAHLQLDGGSYSDLELYNWVRKMRKLRKQIIKWQRQALDRLGMVWHQYDATWANRYDELTMFKKENGHTQVPTSQSKLGAWVAAQRKQYRIMQQGKPSYMTHERIDLLNKINFTWIVNTWNERYQELQVFKVNVGHFLVPSNYSKKQLRPWITTQRTHYRFLQEGKSSQMTPERIVLLEKIGFPWKTREDWETRYEEFIQFINETGTLVVPMNCPRFPKLYRWVNCQKMEYQKYLDNAPSRLKPEQIRSLNDLGFA